MTQASKSPAEQVEQYTATLERMVGENADPRAIGGMKSRLRKATAALEAEQQAEADFNDSQEDELDAAVADEEEAEAQDAEDEAQAEYDRDAAEGAEEAARNAPKPKAKAHKTATTKKAAPATESTDTSQPYCLCGCGAANNAKRDFNQGHDARFKAQLLTLHKGEVVKAYKTDKLEDMPQLFQDAVANPVTFGVERLIEQESESYAKWEAKQERKAQAAAAKAAKNA